MSELTPPMSVLLTVLALASCTADPSPDARDAAACDAAAVCSGRCVDFASDRAHCGACDRACAAGEVCASGTCRSACAGDQAFCDGACVDTATDPAHCGACGRACSAEMECRGGACACPDGLVACGGECVDTDTDSANCGLCERACADEETCTDGSCLCGGRACEGEERCLDDGTCGCSFGARVECACGVVICCTVPDRCVERCDFHCG